MIGLFTAPQMEADGTYVRFTERLTPGENGALCLLERTPMKKAGCLILAISLFTPAAQASSVVQVTFNDLVSSSELIFEGRVVDKRAEMNSQGMIHTYVTFEIQDALKGTYSNRTIVLPYLGGTVG